jgi:hypothetical protein
MSEFDLGGGSGEVIHHTTKSGDPPADPEMRQEWERLHREIEALGRPLEHAEADSEESEQLESHLQDLGYLQK